MKNLALHVNYKWQMFNQLIAQFCLHETQSTKCVPTLYKSQDVTIAISAILKKFDSQYRK